MPGEGMYIEEPGLYHVGRSGTWATDIVGGSIPVKLQVGRTRGNNIQTQRITWTLVVYPETASTIPTVSTVGLVIMAAVALGAGTVVIGKRRVSAA